MNENNLITYYNKFNEDKRLDRRHGIVEFTTTIKYINEYLKDNAKVLDVGAGTGKYSIYLENKNCDVTAVELIKHNMRLIEKNSKNVKVFQGNSTNLSKFNDETYDLVLLFGPMYHLITKEEKIKALNEAKRVCKKDGIIMVVYMMNEFAMLTRAFKDNEYKKEVSLGRIDNNFHITPKLDDLYSYVRLEDINELNKECNLTRIKIIAQDGPTDYMRSVINKMDEETFNAYINYHLSTCEREELLGASAHLLDILKK